MTATAGLGLCKLLGQKEYPPPYATKEANNFGGFVSVDNFSRRADLLRRCIIGEEAAAERLFAFLRADAHPTTFTVPIAVAGLSLLIGSVPIAFSILSLLAFLANAWLCLRIVASLREVPVLSFVPLLAGIGVAAHCLTIRTAGQLHMDPFVSTLGLVSVVLSLRLCERPTAPGFAWLALVHLLGLFTKISYLPFLVAAPLVLLAGHPDRRCARGLAIKALLLGIVPLGVAGGFAWALVGLDNTGADVSHLSHSWDLSPRRLEHFGIEMLLLFQLLPLLFLLRRKAGRSSLPGAVLLLAAIYTASVWAFRLPAVPRLYLPTEFLLITGLAGCLAVESIRVRHLPWLSLYLVANYGIGLYGVLAVWRLV